MTTTEAETGLKPCECGCGELVKGRFKRGHYLRDAANKLTRLPAPGDDLDADEDIIDAEPEHEEAIGATRSGRSGPGLRLPPELQAEIDAEPDEPEPEIPADRPPGRLKERPAPSRGSARAKVRVTAAIRKDVEAKIRFVLVPAGNIWQARDPLCGGTFTAQEPDISEALAEIVCDSPDLLAWFAGPAGGFMKYFKLIMALQPVALTVWLHHIAHAVQVAADGQQPQQMPAYAA